MKKIEDLRNTKWGYLYNSLIEYECTNETPVTLGPSVFMLYFRFDAVTIKFLSERKNIYDFMDGIAEKDYNWLWNLCFIKQHQVFFISCSHEEFCSIDSDVLEIYQDFE